MTEKRFTMNVGISNFTDNQTQKVYSEYNLDEVVDLLNEQDTELTKLANQLNVADDTINDLINEHAQLKLELSVCEKPLFSKRQLHQENQQIKQSIYEAYRNERTQLGRSVLKQLLEAIQ